MATRRVVLCLLCISLSRAVVIARDGQAGPSRANAKFAAPGHCQLNYSRLVLVLEFCYRPVLSGLQLSLAKLQLVVSLAAEPLRPPPAEADGKLNP